MDEAPISLRIEDPLAHRALEALRRADAAVTRRLSSDLVPAGLSATGYEMLVVLTSAGGELELRTLRRRIRTSKANATEVLDTLCDRGLAERHRHERDGRAIVVRLTPAGRLLVAESFPEHAVRVRHTFDVLGEEEKRQLVSICRKLAAAG